VEHHKADVWQVAGHGTAGDDAARFLRELRQLRDAAGLGHAELAARAHYPYDIIKAAEAGPSLPDLPVLSAYVRGCGGTAEEWEERWRRLTRTPSLPVSASRHAGNSAAATAGARIGAATQVVDAPDPSVIIKALNRVAEEMAAGGPGADAAPLTVPPRPACPAEGLPAASSPAGLSSADVPPADVSAGGAGLRDVPLPDATQPDLPWAGVPSSDAPLSGMSLDDAFTAALADNPVAGSADFPPFTPAAPGTSGTSAASADAPLVTPADDPLGAPAAGLTADSPAGWAGPEAGNMPKGWDPIRVSAAWPVISGEDPRRTASSDDTAGARAGSSLSGASAAGSGTRPAIRQSTWARGVDAFGEPTGVARPGSRARTLVVVIVLLCVLAVVLAIFA
jgi:hypothetical protein